MIKIAVPDENLRALLSARYKAIYVSTVHDDCDVIIANSDVDFNIPVINPNGLAIPVIINKIKLTLPVNRGDICLFNNHLYIRDKSAIGCNGGRDRPSTSTGERGNEACG